MYIKDMKQMRHCYKCKKCSKIFNNFKACNHHENKCDELVKHTFPGGRYDKSKSIFDKIEDVYNALIKKEKTYILYHNFKPIVSDKKKYYKYECAFDFEAMLKKIEITDNEKNYKLYQSMFQYQFLYFLTFQIIIINQYFYVMINQEN